MCASGFFGSRMLPFHEPLHTFAIWIEHPATNESEHFYSRLQTSMFFDECFMLFSCAECWAPNHSVFFLCLFSFGFEFFVVRMYYVVCLFVGICSPRAIPFPAFYKPLRNRKRFFWLAFGIPHWHTLTSFCVSNTPTGCCWHTSFTQPSDKHFPIFKLIYNYFTSLVLISIAIWDLLHIRYSFCKW